MHFVLSNAVAGLRPHSRSIESGGGNQNDCHDKDAALLVIHGSFSVAPCCAAWTRANGIHPRNKRPIPPILRRKSMQDGLSHLGRYTS